MVSTRRLAQSWPRARTAGFTLLELLVVIAIIALLASYAGPRLFSQVSKGEVQSSRAQIDGFVKALTAYRLDVGSFPTTAQGLEALMVAPSGTRKWNGPYLSKSIPDDPWGQSYRYVSPGQGHDFELSSTGADKRPGGSGHDADLTSW